MIKITAIGRYYTVDTDDGPVHMMNPKSLIFFLNKHVGLSEDTIRSVCATLNTQSVMELNIQNIGG